MSGGAWLTKDPVLLGRTGLLTQVCADDNDVVLRSCSLVQLWLPVQGSESEEGAAKSTWGPSERQAICFKCLLQETLGSWCKQEMRLAQFYLLPSATLSWVVVMARASLDDSTRRYSLPGTAGI